jgi:hypothetical protein
MTRTATVFVLSLALTLTACGGDGGSDPAGPGNPSNPDNREIKADPSFASDIQEIFNRRGCATSGCHGNAQAGGLDLRSSASYAQLVNVPAQGEDILRVIPGNATGSYLVIKIEGRQNFGAQMPLGGSPLDNIDQTNIRNWINQGARQN